MALEAVFRTVVFIFTLRRVKAIKSLKQRSESFGPSLQGVVGCGAEGGSQEARSWWCSTEGRDLVLELG